MEQHTPQKGGQRVISLDLPDSGKLVLRMGLPDHQSEERGETLFFEIFHHTEKEWNPEKGIPDLAASVTAADLASALEKAAYAKVERFLKDPPGQNQEERQHRKRGHTWTPGQTR